MNDRKQSSYSLDRGSLNYEDSYLCPVCRHGQISSLALMDAFACNFCRHIFTADLTDQSIRVEDSSQPMTWRWNGQSWQTLHQVDVDLTAVIWLIGSALVILPPTFIWISSHTFPPMEGSTWYWFPTVWISLAFLLHLTFVSWLLAEHYQLAPYVACKVRLQMLLGRR